MTTSSEDYQTINEDYEMMIEFPSMYVVSLNNMTDIETIEFYKYVVRTINYPRDARIAIDLLRHELEDLPVIQAYIESLEKNQELSPDDERIIMETVKIIERRKREKRNLINRFVKTIKK